MTPLQITVYQLAGDDMFVGHRVDGTGWDWAWAPWQRDWMNETYNKFAYRCLPLTIANQTGWWVYNPVGFTAVWNSKNEPGNVGFLFDAGQNERAGWGHNQCGLG